MRAQGLLGLCLAALYCAFLSGGAEAAKLSKFVDPGLACEVRALSPMLAKMLSSLLMKSHKKHCCLYLSFRSALFSMN